MWESSRVLVKYSDRLLLGLISVLVTFVKAHERTSSDKRPSPEKSLSGAKIEGISLDKVG